MDDPAKAPAERLQLRRYPNRRYYDATRRRHVKLETIYQLIREGSDVEITDSKSGGDITAKVLTQIILEHDAPKLDVFPVELLHKLIRTNEPLVREFVEKYFSQAFAAFIESQRQFSDYLRGALGLGGVSAAPWTQAMLGPLGPPLLGPSGTTAEESRPTDRDSRNGDADLREAVERLQQEVVKLQDELHRR